MTPEHKAELATMWQNDTIDHARVMEIGNEIYMSGDRLLGATIIYWTHEDDNLFDWIKEWINS